MGFIIGLLVFGLTAFSQVDLGDVEMDNGAMPVIMPQPDDPITSSQELALTMYKRLTGLTTPIDNPLIAQMAERIDQTDLLGAAALVTNDTAFYNFLVRDFAAKMSNRDETVKSPMNDFIATVIGAVRDDRDARDLLTGNFVYRGNAQLPIAQDVVQSMLRSNEHYEQLERNHNAANSLVLFEPQQLMNSNEQAVEHPDPAGLLTTRAFMAAHADAGTNRRLVEYTFRQFLCTPIEHWSDATSSDANVGPDVDRYPGGENTKFQTTCKACHSNMDGFRGAFAQFDFSSGIVKSTLFFPNGDGELEMRQNPPGIAAKMNQNSEVFPEGHITESTLWINNAIRGANAAKFGWRYADGTPIKSGELVTGQGIQEFGRMIANAEGFSRCMAQRVFSTTCGRDVAPTEKEMIQTLATAFEQDGYKLKTLFQRVVARAECLGLEAQ